ncbi:MAG: hypothetical protein KY475_08295 [Planctomycetes bacterium]|nr:hypothetical protein [Planctomycetota bacterium]
MQKVKKNEKGEEQISDVAQVDDPGDRNNRIGTDFDTSTDDPSWKLEANEDATYRIQVRDNFGSSRADPRYAYRLIVRRTRPDFRLIATPEPGPTTNNNQVLQYASVLRRGGSTYVEIRAERLDGFDGEIEVTAEGLPPGVTCTSAILGGNVKEGCLVFTADENGPAWNGPITVVGKAKIGESEVVRSARPGSLVWGTNNRQQETPIARMARDLVLSVIETETAPALVKVGDGQIIETSKGAKVELPVTSDWRGEIKGDIALAQVGAPNEFQVKNLNLKKGQDGKLEFTLNNNNIQPGAYTFYLRGTTKLAYDRNQDAVKDHQERQKEIDAIIKELQEKAKQAADAKTKTTQAAQEAAQAVKQKEQAVAAAKPEEAEKANQELAAAREQLKAAEEAKAQSEAEDKAAQDLVKQAQERKKQIDAQLKQVQQANQKKDINLFLVSTPIRLRIASDPIEPSAQAPAAVKQGEKTEISVSVNRLYGFDDQVEVTLETPGVSGVSAPKINIAKGQSDGKLEVTAAGNASVGEHTVNLRFRVRFNNVQLDEVVPVTLKVEMAEKK